MAYDMDRALDGLVHDSLKADFKPAAPTRDINRQGSRSLGDSGAQQLEDRWRDEGRDDFGPHIPELGTHSPVTRHRSWREQEGSKHTSARLESALDALAASWSRPQVKTGPKGQPITVHASGSLAGGPPCASRAIQRKGMADICPDADRVRMRYPSYGQRPDLVSPTHNQQATSRPCSRGTVTPDLRDGLKAQDRSHSSSMLTSHNSNSAKHVSLRNGESYGIDGGYEDNHTSSHHKRMDSKRMSSQRSLALPDIYANDSRRRLQVGWSADVPLTEIPMVVPAPGAQYGWRAMKQDLGSLQARNNSLRKSLRRSTTWHDLTDHGEAHSHHTGAHSSRTSPPRSTTAPDKGAQPTWIQRYQRWLSSDLMEASAQGSMMRKTRSSDSSSSWYDYDDDDGSEGVKLSPRDGI